MILAPKSKKLYFKKEKKSLKPKRHKASSSKPKVIFSAKDVEKQSKKKLMPLQFPRISRFITEWFGKLAIRAFGKHEKTPVGKSIISSFNAQKIKSLFSFGKYLGKYSGKNPGLALIVLRLVSPFEPLKKKNVWLASVFLLALVFATFLSWELWQTWTRWQKVESDYISLKQQLQTWEDVTNRYPTYRDAYFEAAVLAYRLGDRHKEALYLQKVLTIDPNFLPAQQLKNLSK